MLFASVILLVAAVYTIVVWRIFRRRSLTPDSRCCGNQCKNSVSMSLTNGIRAYGYCNDCYNEYKLQVVELTLDDNKKELVVLEGFHWEAITNETIHS